MGCVLFTNEQYTPFEKGLHDVKKNILEKKEVVHILKS